jgi:endonuclease/exonuclease/phosphatase family metal-dependent hydrolase
MPSFPKPKVRFEYHYAAEIARLRRHKRARGVPEKSPADLLILSWNIANFGAHERRHQDRRLIAEILSWFDIAAIQECRDNFGDLFDVLDMIGKRYAAVLSDAGGNGERMVFVYDRTKVTLLEEVGEITFPPTMCRWIRLRGVRQRFEGFDRAPYLASFKLNRRLSVLLINVHLFYGSASRRDIERRALETAAVARWAATRRRSPFSFAREVVALGDFNMPKPSRDGGNIVYDALTQQGLITPAQSTSIGSAIASDNHYDQVALFPGTTQNFSTEIGVFDYDTVVFPNLWKGRSRAAFYSYLRYYLSDHRPLWIRMRQRDLGAHRAQAA